MGLRVADPNRLRVFGLAATLLGLLWVFFGMTRGMLLLFGLPVLAVGVAAIDLAHDGRLSIRQLGVVLAIVAAGLAMWVFFVILFIGVLDEGSVSWVWYVALLLSAVATGAGLVMRLRPEMLSGIATSAMRTLPIPGRKRAAAGRHAASARAELARRRGAPRAGA